MDAAKQFYVAMAPTVLPIVFTALGAIVVLYIKAIARHGRYKSEITGLSESLKGLVAIKDRVRQLETQASILASSKCLLDEQNANLHSQVDQITEERDRVQESYRQLQEEHSEEVSLWHTIEFRRGKRTDGKWLPFCPNCKQPISPGPNAHGEAWCSGQCGWRSGIQADALQWAMKQLSVAKSQQLPRTIG